MTPKPDKPAFSPWKKTAPVRALAALLGRLGLSAWRGSQSRGTKAPDSIAPDQYRRWLDAYGTISPPARAAMEASIAAFAARPLISVIMPVYNIELRWLRAAIASVREQIYPHFELCISDDASTIEGIRELLKAEAAQDERIRITFRETNGHISANSNSALALATGAYIALMDADDVLPPDALYLVAHAISGHPDVDLLFSDEDKIDEEGRRFDPYFKSAWNPALMLSHNAFSHLGVFRRDLVEQVGAFREGFEGSQDHDLVLRCAEATKPERIRHIPRVLYHWRTLPGSAATSEESKPYAWHAGRRAIEEHLKRTIGGGSVQRALAGYYQVSYDMPAPQPLVSVIVAQPSVDQLNSILSNTAYRNFELILAAGFEDVEAARAVASDPRIRILANEENASDRMSWINRAAAEARGSLFCFLDGGVAPRDNDWLDLLVARAVLDDIGIAAPMITDQSGQILHAGIILGADGVAGYPFRGFDAASAGYIGRAALEQDYTCVSSACMVIRRDAFHATRAFNASQPTPLDEIDFCLRVRRAGLRTVWVPTAKMQHRFTADSGVGTPHDAGDVLRARWGDIIKDDPCYSPNLSLTPDRLFQLDIPPRIAAPRETSPDALLTIESSRTASI